MRLEFLAIAIVIVGWFISYRLMISRDRLNKVREQRILYLIDAYRILSKSAHKDKFKPEEYEELERAFSDIQLLGSVHQIRLVRNFMTEFNKQKSASIYEIIETLRDDLRKELNLEEVDSEIRWIRFNKD